MTPYELGKVSAFLLKNRKIEERSQRRAIQREERDFAEILRDAGVEEIQMLEEMMPGYGFDFVTLKLNEAAGRKGLRGISASSQVIDFTCDTPKLTSGARGGGVTRKGFTRTAAMFSCIAGKIDGIDGKHVVTDQTLSVAGEKSWRSYAGQYHRTSNFASTDFEPTSWLSE